MAPIEFAGELVGQARGGGIVWARRAISPIRLELARAPVSSQLLRFAIILLSLSPFHEI
jgi:hypothetical protein